MSMCKKSLYTWIIFPKYEKIQNTLKYDILIYDTLKYLTIYGTKCSLPVSYISKYGHHSRALDNILL